MWLKGKKVMVYLSTKAQIPVTQIWRMLGTARFMSDGKHVWKTSVHTLAKLQTSVGRR